MSWTAGRSLNARRENRRKLTPKDTFYPFIARYMERNGWCAQGALLKRYLEKVMNLNEHDLAPVKSKMSFRPGRKQGGEKAFHKTVNNIFREMREKDLVTGQGNIAPGWQVTAPGRAFITTKSAEQRRLR